MDWSKAKTILIVALLVTNIFLVATYGTMGVKDDPEAFDQEALITLLEHRGVYLETKIPKHSKAMDVVAVELVRSVDEEVKALLASEGASDIFHIKDKFPRDGKPEWLNIDNADVANAYVAASVDFISALGFMNESVKFERIFITDDDFVQVEFENIYDGINLEESTLICKFRQGGLVDMEALWLKPINSNKRKVSVMDPAIALLALVSEKEPEEKWIVTTIELTYWLNTEESNLEDTVTDTAFPAWCITYNEGEKMYFTAAQI